MKKISILLVAAGLLLACLFTMQSQAQIAGGVKAGLNFSNFNTDSGNDDMKAKTGLVIGGFGNYQVMPKLAVQAELMFSQQGAKEGDGTYDFNYFTLPVTARYNIWNNLHLVTGPQIGFLASAKINSQGEKEDIKDNVKGGDFSWVLGAGYEMSNGFVADLRFVKGLSDISDNSNSIRNTGIQLTVGYRFAGRK